GGPPGIEDGNGVRGVARERSDGGDQMKCIGYEQATGLENAAFRNIGADRSSDRLTDVTEGSHVAGSGNGGGVSRLDRVQCGAGVSDFGRNCKAAADIDRRDPSPAR